ncbi:MAPEG family protein [Microvirga tunisiensis]|uniref:MAPEG family protein n=1 Tax=Microvirga tunisiensis TaxID=2108360 RepID=A0A5N7MSS2_9HYPH|nr:hypothetical protein [Microvirga tunisiensis]MPR27056.1 hypothetical protein [Microvirga tunisiensis]
MSITAILLPVYVQVALTFILLLWMGSSRLGSLRAGEVKVKDVALGERNWPSRILQVQNAYHNQFELPVLFYMLVTLAPTSDIEHTVFDLRPLRIPGIRCSDRPFRSRGIGAVRP